MKKADEQALLVRASFHEAGCAVASYLLRKRFGDVTIKPGEKPKEVRYPNPA